jgi:hypothetical protein
MRELIKAMRFSVNIIVKLILHLFMPLLLFSILIGIQSTLRPAKWYKLIMQNLTALWESYWDQAPISTLSISFNNWDIGKEKGKEKQLDRYDQIAQDLNKYTRLISHDEFRDYCAIEPYDIGKITALNWWCQDQQMLRWPKLSRMALDILSIPAMSDEPERVFSGARHTVSWERSQLDV